ncbi:MAG: zf-HC2 domain-containing protein [Candidatus Eisenbacteria bacterium]
MTHLSPEQLSALHDGALAGTDLASAEAHLSACEACRVAMTELAELDASLDAALAHDPGDAYFADFASRVQTRIAAEAAAAEVAPAPVVRPVVPAPRRSPWFAPRAFGFAGAAAALVVTAGLAWMLFGRTLAPTDLMRANEMRSERSEPAAGAPAESPLAEQAVPEPTMQSAPEPGAQPGVGTTPERPAVAPFMKDAVPVSPRPQAARALGSDERARATAHRQTSTESRTSGSVQPPAANEAMTPKLMSEVTGASEPAASGPAATATPAPAAAASPAPPSDARREAEARHDAAPSTTPRAPAAGSAPSSGWGKLKAFTQPASPAPALAGGTAKTRALVGQSLDLQQSAAAIEPACGVVRDSRGTPLGGAQLTLLGATTRSARSAKDGSFCLERPMVGDTLLVMRVGYEPVRLVLVSSSALALALEPVGTLGSQDGLVAGGGETRDRLGSALGARTRAPQPDVYARESVPLREAVSAARDAAAMAARERTSLAWERAAAAWRAIGAATTDAASYDARFREIAALREAWLLTPDAAHRERFEQAAAAFVVGTPRALPERATVQRWQQELRRGPASR